MKDEPTLNDLKVFVYGTLKPGERNYPQYCAGKVMEEKNAIAWGQLFSLPVGYPAMTPGDTPVRGYLLTFSNLDVLHQLDRLEGYVPHRPPEHNEYNRQLIEVVDLSGQPLGSAWTYLMTLEKIRDRRGTFLPSGWWSESDSSYPSTT